MKGPGALGPTKPPRISGAGGPRPHLSSRVRRLWIYLHLHYPANYLSLFSNPYGIAEGTKW